MELRLKVLEGKHAGQEIRVSGPKFLIGRGDDCQLRPSSDSVSRRHCMLQIEDGRATVCDLGSRNGTLVNDQPVQGQFILKTGDFLSIGHLRFEVSLTTGLKGQKQPVVKDVKDAATRTHDAATTEELDVDSWLQSADPVRPTRELSTTDTRKLSLSDTSPGVEADTVIGRSGKAPDTADKPADGSKSSGKLPRPTISADGGSAAAEILRKLAKYR